MWSAVPDIQTRLRPLLRTPLFPERCCPTTQVWSRWNVPPQVGEPLGALKVWCPNLWERVREEVEWLFRRHLCMCVYCIFILTVHEPPAGDVTGEAMRQHLMDIR